MISYLIDAFLAVMLVTTTGYMLIVNRRLKTLRSGQSDLNALITTFSRTIDETDASVKRLTETAADIAVRLGSEVDRGKAMTEEVTLLLGSCERTAGRMEEQILHTRQLLRRLDAATPARPTRPAIAEAIAEAAAMAEDEAGPSPAELRAEPEFRPLAAFPPAPSIAPAAARNTAEPTVAQPRTERTSRVAAGDFYATLRSVAPST